MTAKPTTVDVVGAGIAGLTTAWALQQEGVEVVVHEAGDHVGGKAGRAEVAGIGIETGPDSFLARVPEAVELCHLLGMGDELVAPATGRAYVWSRGALRDLPDGLVLGVPTRVGPLLRGGLLSRRGTLRAALDLGLPGRAFDADVPVARAVGARMGREVVERLVDPLLGGINAGSCDELSLAAGAPQLFEPARQGGSLMRALRGPRAAGTGPVFLAPRNGMLSLAERLARELDVRLGARVDDIDALGADAIVLATPAFVTAALMRERSPEAARELDAIRYASVVLTTFAFPAGTPLPPGSGLLVPRVEGRLLTAATFVTQKWLHVAPGGPVLVRASAGRAGDERAMQMDDDTLVHALRAELRDVVGIDAEPVDAHVARWPRAFPQYDVGHLERVARIEDALVQRAPGILVTGAAYNGVGVASCVRAGRSTAAALLAARRG